MKRGQETRDFSVAEKMPKLEYNLFNLPDDDFKHVLDYLDTATKGNLKLTSKFNEKRIMRLDPTMRNWRVKFRFFDWEPLGLCLWKARVKHSLDRNVESIKISLEILFRNLNETFFSIQFLTAHVINQWKKNIVHLGMKVSGLEFFLLDPELKMPQLKSLRLFDWDKSSIPEEGTKHHKSEIFQIVNVMLEKQKDTLERLEIRHLEFSPPLNLRLREFIIHGRDGISSEGVISVLTNSKSTLETFECHYIEVSGENDKMKDINLELKLTKFTAYKTDLLLVATVIKSAQSSLKQLELEFMNSRFVSKFDLGNLQLDLTHFTAKNLSSDIVLHVLQASQNYLKHFQIKDCFVLKHDDPFFRRISPLNLTQLKLTQLKLKSYSSHNTSFKYLLIVFQSSRDTLEDLSISKDDFEPVAEFITLLRTNEFKLLKKFSSENTSTKLCTAVINSAHSSLLTLVLKSIGDNLKPDLNRLNLNVFQATAVNIGLLSAVITRSQTSLEHLELSEILRIEENTDNILEETVKLNLKRLSCDDLWDYDVARIINCSITSLEHLNLSFINMEEEHFNLQGDLELKSFTGFYLSPNIVNTVFKSSQKTFNFIKLNVNVNDPEMTKLLMEVKDRNPFCMLKITHAYESV